MAPMAKPQRKSDVLSSATSMRTLKPSAISACAPLVTEEASVATTATSDTANVIRTLVLYRKLRGFIGSPGESKSTINCSADGWASRCASAYLLYERRTVRTESIVRCRSASALAQNCR